MFRYVIFEAIRQMFRGQVQAGPFAGLKYINPNIPCTFPAKLLGTYEKELYPTLEAILKESWDCIVDVGAQEGFYAVGLARFAKTPRVVAFEMETVCHPVLMKLARLNGVEGKIDLRGFCDGKSFTEALPSGSGNYLAFLDVEGHETDILDPVAVPQLNKTTILVETHDLIRAGTQETLIKRFSPTHSITVIKTEPRTIRDIPENVYIPLRSKLASFFTNEYRLDKQTWLYMVPR